MTDQESAASSNEGADESKNIIVQSANRQYCTVIKFSKELEINVPAAWRPSGHTLVRMYARTGRRGPRGRVPGAPSPERCTSHRARSNTPRVLPLQGRVHISSLSSVL